MSRSLARVEAALAAAELPVRVIEAGACRTAEEAAAAVGCAVDQIAKSIIFRGEDTGHVVLFSPPAATGSIRPRRPRSPGNGWARPTPR